jgi:HK97 family phage major capsid protein
MGSVDEPYATNGAWMMNFATYIAIRKLKASTGGSYIFPPEPRVDGRPALLERPVILSPSMPNMGASAKPVCYGDFSRFIRFQQGDIAIRVWKERYAEYDQVAYSGVLRTDGHLLRSDTINPVAYLQMAAS